MYGAAKIALYLFLLERVHIVRAPFVDRVRDPIYALGAILTIGGFAAVMAYQCIDPTAELSREDGICRIGNSTWCCDRNHRPRQRHQHRSDYNFRLAATAHDKFDRTSITKTYSL